MGSAGFQRPGKHGDGPEGRQQERGIPAGGQTDEKRDGRQGRNQPGRPVVHTQFLAGQQVELRQQQMYQDEGDGQRNQGEQHRFSDELPDQLNPLGAQDLSDSDLLRSAGGTGRGQVHEVDAGDYENEDGQRREYVYVPDVAVGPDLVIKVGVQVDFREGLQVGTGFDADGRVQFAQISVQERPKPGFHFLARMPFPQ